MLLRARNQKINQSRIARRPNVSGNCRIPRKAFYFTRFRPLSWRTPRGNLHYAKDFFGRSADFVDVFCGHIVCLQILSALQISSPENQQRLSPSTAGLRTAGPPPAVPNGSPAFLYSAFPIFRQLICDARRLALIGREYSGAPICSEQLREVWRVPRSRARIPQPSDRWRSSPSARR